MKSSMKVAVIAIVAVSVIVVAAWALTSNNDDIGDKSVVSSVLTQVDEYPEARLWLLGNAVQDDVLNQKDIDYIKDVVNGKKDKNIFCDANNDGVIDARDIEVIKNVIGHKPTKVWFVDVDKMVSSMNYPSKKNITTYTRSVEQMQVLGVTDRMVATDDNVFEHPRFANVHTGLPSVGSRFSPDHEAILKIHKKTPFDTYFTGTRAWYDKTLEDTLSKIGVSVVRLPSYENGNSIQGTVTLRWLFGIQDQECKYLDFHDKIINTIKSRVATIPEDKKVKCFFDGDTSTYGTGSGAYESTIMCGGNNLAKHYLVAGKMYPSYDFEDLLKRKPTVLFRLAGDIYTPGNMKFTEEMNKMKARYGPDYNATFCVTGYDNAFGPAYVVTLILFAKVLYPELFKDMDFDKTMKDYVDNIVKWNLDLSTITTQVTVKQ